MKNDKSIERSLSQLTSSLGIKETDDLAEKVKNLDVQVFEVLDFVPDLVLTIRSYVVRESFQHVLGNISTIENGIMFSFHNFFKDQLDQNSPIRTIEEIPHIKIIPINTSQVYYFKEGTHMKHISILISRDYLKSFLKNDAKKFLCLLETKESFAIEEFMSDSILQVVNEIVNSTKTNSLPNFFYKLKSLELLYLLFQNLEKREQPVFQKLNPAEIENLYKVRDKLIARLDKAPSLSELKAIACMNEIKLRKLFIQIFGMGIYDYFQLIRMKEAARLLKENGKNVSEVGYDLGFTNLSHFSREFEKYVGMKPKKFQRS